MPISEVDKAWAKEFENSIQSLPTPQTEQPKNTGDWAIHRSGRETLEGVKQAFNNWWEYQTNEELRSRQNIEKEGWRKHLNEEKTDRETNPLFKTIFDTQSDEEFQQGAIALGEYETNLVKTYGNALMNFVVSDIQGERETMKAREALAQIGGMVADDTLEFMGYEPEVTDNQKRLEFRYENAKDKFYENTISPLVNVAVPAAVAFIGGTTLGIGVAALAGASWITSMIGTGIEAYEKTGSKIEGATTGITEGTKSTILGMIPAYENAKKRWERGEFAENAGRAMGETLIESAPEFAFLLGLGASNGSLLPKGNSRLAALSDMEIMQGASPRVALMKQIFGDMVDKFGNFVDETAIKRYWRSSEGKQVKEFREAAKKAVNQVDEQMAKAKDEFIKKTETVKEEKKPIDIDLNDVMETSGGEKIPVRISESLLDKARERGMTAGDLFEAMQNPAMMSKRPHKSYTMSITAPDGDLLFISMKNRTNRYVATPSNYEPTKVLNGEVKAAFVDRTQIGQTANIKDIATVAGELDLERNRYAFTKIIPNLEPSTGKAEPITRKEVMSLFKDIFDIEWGTGKGWNPKIAGLYEKLPQNARVSESADWASGLHETGHHVADTIGFKGNPAEMRNTSETLWGNRKDYQRLSDELKLEEGRAEFFRQYLQEPKGIADRFPKSYGEFVDKLEQNPDLLGKVNALGKGLRRYYNQNDYARGIAGMTFTDDIKLDKRNITGTREWFSKQRLKLRTAIFDDKAPIEDMLNKIQKITGEIIRDDNNFYIHARHVDNSIPAQIGMLFDRKGTETPAQVITALNHAMGIGDVMPHAVTAGDLFNKIDVVKIPKEVLKAAHARDNRMMFDVFWEAKRSTEIRKKRPKWENGEYTPDFCERIIESAPEEFEPILKQFDLLTDNINRARLKSGIISQKMYDVYSKNKYYAPVHRDMSMNTETGAAVSKGSSKGFVNKSRNDKALTEFGSSKNVKSPSEEYTKFIEDSIDLINKNNLMRKVVAYKDIQGIGGLIKARPDMKGAEDPANGVFFIYENGKKVSYQTPPEYYDAMTRYGKQTFGRWLTYATFFASMLRIGATLTPMFATTNAIRDTNQAAIMTRNGQVIPYLNTAKGMYMLKSDLPKYSQYRADFKAMGVPISTWAGTARRDIPWRETAKWKDLMENPAVNAMDKVMSAAVKTIEKAQDLNEWIESSPRFNEFVAAMESGKGLYRAALDAKDVTLDFSRGGTITRNINRFIPFFNAAIQGIDRVLLEGMLKHPLRTGGRMATVIFLPKTIEWALMHDNDLYNDIPDYVKDSNLLIPIGDDYMVRLQYPQEMIPFAAAWRRGLQSVIDNDEDAFDGYWHTWWDNIVPDLNVAFYRPLLEMMSGYNFWLNKPTVPYRYQRLMPEYQYNARTSMLSRKVGSWLKISPMQLDALVQSTGASTGSTILHAFDYPLGKEYEMPEQDVRDMALPRRFLHNMNQGSQAINDAHEIYARLEQEEYTLKKDAPNTAAYHAMKNGMEKLRTQEQKAAEVLNSKTLSASEKKNKLIEINRNAKNIAQGVMRIYKEKRQKK